ncbi:hypothetical protein Daesc_005619 [Daldinia eschscholtzii]|uniref:Uncharacterized protein n=1 Tax=Daldinia eschscholtzii TaxID=292717 RepID=A0AAX6MLP3_9PEZI
MPSINIQEGCHYFDASYADPGIPDGSHGSNWPNDNKKSWWLGIVEKLVFSSNGQRRGDSARKQNGQNSITILAFRYVVVGQGTNKCHERSAEVAHPDLFSAGPLLTCIKWRVSEERRQNPDHVMLGKPQKSPGTRK